VSRHCRSSSDRQSRGSGPPSYRCWGQWCCWQCRRTTRFLPPWRDSPRHGAGEAARALVRQPPTTMASQIGISITTTGTTISTELILSIASASFGKPGLEHVPDLGHGRTGQSRVWSLLRRHLPTGACCSYCRNPRWRSGASVPAARQGRTVPRHAGPQPARPPKPAGHQGTGRSVAQAYETAPRARGLRVHDGGVFEPQAGACDLRFGNGLTWLALRLRRPAHAPIGRQRKRRPGPNRASWWPVRGITMFAPEPCPAPPGDAGSATALNLAMFTSAFGLELRNVARLTSVSPSVGPRLTCELAGMAVPSASKVTRGSAWCC
jgi:hypothetical protein